MPPLTLSRRPALSGFLAGACMVFALAGLPQVQGQTAMPLVPLSCRLADGPWQDCQMRLEQVGAHWWLLIGAKRFEFRHDGRGAVTMQADQGGWKPVQPRWSEDAALCWDGVCAKGDIPLD